MSQNKFYRLDNMKILLGILKDRLMYKYNFDISKNEDISKTKQLVYSIMTQINKESISRDIDFKELNGMVLKELILYYIDLYDLNNKYSEKSTPDKDNRKLESSIIDKVENQEDFLKKLKNLENDRARISQDTIQNKNKIFKNIDIDNETKRINDTRYIDPKKIYSYKPEQSISLTDNFKQKIDDSTYKKLQNKLFDENGDRSTIIERKDNDKVLIKKYIDINSADRNWLQDKYRFKYSINFLTNDNDIQSRYRNIQSIRVEKVIMPQDTVYGVYNNDENSTQPYRPYLHSFTLNLPFVYLIIDELSDVYDGTNDTIRRCFSKLVVDRVINTMELGRKYIVLKSAGASGDEKIFFPTPLSTLNRLSISLMKPNGNLINTSHDHYLISNISYNNSFSMYLQVTLRDYFDINEFNMNDLVIFKQYNMTQLYNTQNSTDIIIFNEWINHQDGHKVVDVGGKNENNYYNIIYIMAPNTYDPVMGNNLLKNNLINVLNNYNNNTIPPSSGILMNYSLQNSISFTIKTYNEDSSFINEFSTHKNKEL